MRESSLSPVGSARRIPMLTPTPLDVLAPVAVAPLPPSARFVLRLDPAIAGSLGSAGGFDLRGAINTCRVTGALTAARLGPDEWLLLGPDADSIPLLRAVSADLAAHHHSLVDAGHRNVAVAVSGAQARTVLSAGCPLDLDDGAFPPGTATRTLLGKAEVVLLRPGAERLYRVECWRSFATYVHGFLTEVAQEFTPR